MDISRISRTSATTAAGKSGGAKRSGGTDFKSLLDVEEADEAAPAGALGGVRGLGALLLAQESGDAMEGRQKNRKRARELLDKLEELRMGILAGKISPAQLRALAQTVAAERAQMEDPELAALLDDIELRAAVELAKLGLV